MKNFFKNTSGFAAGAVVLCLVLLAIIGVAGWTVYENNKDDGNSQQSSTSSEDNASQINSASDIDTAQAELDSSELDKDLDTSALDTDIEAIL